MFTGIVEELGTVLDLQVRPAGALLTVAASTVLQDATVGSSIAVNGACLTALDISSHKWSADISPETWDRTNLSDLSPHSLVNLERPLRANARLDGHFVLGHVDATAEVVSLDPLGNDNWWLRIRAPQALTRYIVQKGSLAIDGISLTVAEVADDLVGFTVIPHTYQNTALHTRRLGSRLNIEVDILAKHLEKLLGRSPA